MSPSLIWAIIAALLSYFSSRRAGMPALAAAAVGVGAGMVTYDYLTPPATGANSSGVSTTKAADPDGVASGAAAAVNSPGPKGAASDGLLSSMTSYVKDHPLASAGAAFGAASLFSAEIGGIPLWIIAVAAYLAIK